jgi:hypothetical protein
MSELVSAFNSEVFRPVVSLVVPGFFALSTSCVALGQQFPDLLSRGEDHSGILTIVAFLTVLTFGLTIEDIGAHLERRFDRDLKKTANFEKHMDEWFSYLRLAFKIEPVGHRYLRTLVLRMKFELGMTVASVPFALGTLLLKTNCVWHVVMALIAALAAFFFYGEAKCSHEALSKLRREMLKREMGNVGESA